METKTKKTIKKKIYFFKGKKVLFQINSKIKINLEALPLSPPLNVNK